MTFSIKKKILKKFVSSLTMLATIVSMSGMMALSNVAAAEAIADGALIKSNATNPDGTPTVESLDVYIVKVVGTKKFKRLILNPTVFESYGHLNWGDIQTVSQSVMDEYTTSSLVRVDTDPDEKVYAMAPDGDIGSKSWINLTTAEAESVSGYDPDSVYTINAVDGGNYTAVNDITTVDELASFYADGTLPGVTPVPAEGVTVALSADTPAAGTIVAGQAVANLANFTFTNGDSSDVNVTNVVLKRIGVSADDTLSDVYLYNGTTRITDAATVSNGTVTFANSAGLFTIPSNSSVTISVKSNILSNTSGQTVGVELSGVTSDASSVSGLPVQGGVSTVATASLATVSVGTVTPSSSTSVDAGTNNYTIWSAPFTIGTRYVNLSHASFKVIGSIQKDAISNIGLYLNGTQIATANGIDSNNLINFDTAEAVKVNTGSQTLEVRANIVKGSNRNFSVSLQNAADIVLVDSNYGVNVSVTGIPAQTSTINVNAGSVSVSTDPNFVASTITNGASNVTIAQYAFKAYGENMKISYLTVTPSTSLDNVALYVNGSQVGSTYNYTGTALTFSLGSSFVIPAGQTSVVAVKADTKVGGANLGAGVTSINVSLNGSANNAQGMSSLEMSTVPSSAVASQSLTVNSSNLTIAPNTGVSDHSILANTANQKIGSFVLQAGSGEDLNVTNFMVDLSADTFPVTSLSNLYISYGGTNSNPINPQDTNNNFPVTQTLAKSGSENVDVYADVGSLGTVANTTHGSVAINNSASSGSDSTPAVGTVTITGTAAGSLAVEATINGISKSVATTASESLATIAGDLADAINADTNLSGSVTAVGNTDGTVTITANTAGTIGHFTLEASATDTGLTVGPTLETENGSDGTAQQNTITVNSDVVLGNVYTATISQNGVESSASFTAADTIPTNVAVGLVSAINGLSGVSATNSSNVITITSDTLGTAASVGTLATSVTVANGTQGTSGTYIQAKITVTATGAVSNTPASATSNLGQKLTLATGSLSSPTLVSTSPVTQLVVSGTTQNVASYNFVSNVGTSVINEMKFTTDADNTITSVSVGGVSTPVVYDSTNSVNVADITGLNISIPASYAGVDVPVSVTYNKVGLNGLATDNLASTVTLTYVKYVSGNTTSELTPSVSANGMYLVASKPSVTLADSAAQLVTGQVKLASVTVSADSAGPIELVTLPITSNMTGTVGVSTTASLVVNVSGSAVSGATGTFAASTGGNVSISFSTPYTIPAGSSVTFDIYGTATGVSGTVGTASISTTLGAASSFTWDDVNANTTGLTGANIFNYPTNTSVITN